MLDGMEKTRGSRAIVVVDVVVVVVVVVVVAAVFNVVPTGGCIRLIHCPGKPMPDPTSAPSSKTEPKPIARPVNIDFVESAPHLACLPLSRKFHVSPDRIWKCRERTAPWQKVVPSHDLLLVSASTTGCIPLSHLWKCLLLHVYILVCNFSLAFTKLTQLAHKAGQVTLGPTTKNK